MVDPVSASGRDAKASGQPPLAPRKCVQGADVLRDGDVADTERLDIWIEGETIVALTAAGERPPFDEPCERIDGRGCVAIPGLVNAHTHSYSALLKGTCAGEPLDLFVLEAMSRKAPRSQAMVRASALLQSVELLKRGVTAQVDHFRHGVCATVESMDAVFAAYRDVGIRAAVAPMYEDLPYLASLPIDAARLPAAIRDRFARGVSVGPQAYFEMLEEVHRRWNGVEGRLDVMIGVDGPQRCTAVLLELAGDFARRHGAANHTHVLEAKTQALVADRVGGSLVTWLDRFGLVNERSSFAHFVWADEADMELVAARGASAVHNPVSNLHLGSGVAQLPVLLRRGVNVALGTDGGSGSGMSILEQAKFAALLSRLTEPDPREWVQARTAFKLATEGGAHVLGLRGRSGRIAPGMKADLALFDATGLTWTPRGDPFMQLVMYETGHGTKTVLVGGEVVVRDGTTVRVDEAALLAETAEMVKAIARDNAESLAACDAERPTWRPLILEALTTPAGVDRLMHRGITG